MSDTNKQILSAVSIIITYVNGVGFILGTVGNVMNMIAFGCLKTYRPLVTSSFLAGAAFAAQIYLTVSLGIASVSKWISYDIPSRNAAICKFYLYTRTVSIQIYLTCLCLSSIDRYLMTSRTACLRELMTLKRARLLICGLSIIWMCVGIPRVLYSNNIPQFNLCIPSSDFSAAVTYFNLIVVVTLPVTILSISGFLTWKNVKNIRASTLNTQVTRMILLDVIIVALSNIPMGMFLIYAVTNAMNRLFTPTESLLVTLAQFISTIQAFSSFYFYLAASSVFRNNIKKLFYDIFCFWKPKTAQRIAPLPTAAQTNTYVLSRMTKVAV